MIDPVSRAVLEEIARHESRSLIQYVRDAFPWTTPAEQQALARLQEVVEEETAAVSDLMRFLIKNRLPPPLAAYPDFTGLNFVSLKHLQGLLVAHQRRASAQIEQALPRIIDPAARALVQRLLDVKRRHLQTLEHLEDTPEPVAHH